MDRDEHNRYPARRRSCPHTPKSCPREPEVLPAGAAARDGSLDPVQVGLWCGEPTNGVGAVLRLRAAPGRGRPGPEGAARSLHGRRQLPLHLDSSARPHYDFACPQDRSTAPSRCCWRPATQPTWSSGWNMTSCCFCGPSCTCRGTCAPPGRTRTRHWPTSAPAARPSAVGRQLVGRPVQGAIHRIGVASRSCAPIGAGWWDRAA